VIAQERSDVMAMFEAVPDDLKTNEREAAVTRIFIFVSALARGAFCAPQLRKSMSTRTGRAGKTI
jgi:hypothetical protein